MLFPLKLKLILREIALFYTNFTTKSKICEAKYRGITIQIYFFPTNLNITLQVQNKSRRLRQNQVPFWWNLQGPVKTLVISPYCLTITG